MIERRQSYIRGGLVSRHFILKLIWYIINNNSRSILSIKKIPCRAGLLLEAPVASDPSRSDRDRRTRLCDYMLSYEIIPAICTVHSCVPCAS